MVSKKVPFYKKEFTRRGVPLAIPKRIIYLNIVLLQHIRWHTSSVRSRLLKYHAASLRSFACFLDSCLVAFIDNYPVGTSGYDQRNLVLSNQRIPAYQRQVFCFSLRDLHAVEWVLMDRRQRSNGQGVCNGYG